MKFVKFLKDIIKDDIPEVGGKGANLGEMYNAGLPVPNAFIVTAQAYKHFLDVTRIRSKIFSILETIDYSNPKDLEEKTASIRKLIEETEMPQEIKEEIVKAYKQLSQEFGKEEEWVAIRSSATAEDLPSIAGDEFVLVRINGVVRHLTMDELWEKFNSEDCILEVPSMENGRVVWKRVKEVYRHPCNDKLYEIMTKSGRRVVVSPNHSLIILDEKSFKPKVLQKTKDAIGKKVRVPVTRRLELKPLNRKKLKELLPVNMDNLNLDEDFFYFFGIFAADGTVDKHSRSIILSVFDQSVVERIKTFAKKLGIRVSTTKKDELRLYSKKLVELLENIAVKDSGKKGKGRYVKLVPDIVFNAEKKFIAEFVKGCFDGDGTVESTNVSFYNTSKRLISGLTKLLEVLGIDFYIRRKGKSLTIKILTRDTQKFLRIVGFENRRKFEKAKRIAKEFGSRERHHDFIYTLPFPTSHVRKILEERLQKRKVKVYLCPYCKNKVEKSSHYKGRERFYCRNCHKTFYSNEVIVKEELKYVGYDELGRFLEGMIPWNKGIVNDVFGIKKLQKVLSEKYGISLSEIVPEEIYWDEVKGIKEREYSGYVYDFFVPGVENFAAGTGGIITHNSASFAGQQLTLLNVKGAEQVVEGVKKCWASLFTARATFYRHQKGFSHEKVLIAVPVQKQLGALSKEDYLAGKYKAGVGFTIHPSTGDKTKILIEGSWGQGESVVSGSVNPDTYVLDKETGKVVEKHVGDKLTMRYTDLEKGGLVEISVPKELQKIECLTEDELHQLWGLAKKLEEHYGFPQDFEWASEYGKVFLLQTRPVTVFYEKRREEEKLKIKPLVKGLTASPGAAVGRVIVAKTLQEAEKLEKGDVLVTTMTNPDWVPYMKIASAIITDEGGITCHAAIVSRELGIPCIVGTENATKVLKDGQVVTVDATNGVVYPGKIEDIIEREKKEELSPEEIEAIKKLKTKTKVLMNLGVPEKIEDYKDLPFEGIGLMRIEFIIATYIGEHPNYLLEIGQEQKYVDKLAEGIAMVAKAIYPRFVVVRFSDFKTNEYRLLKGGKKYEPEEDNPMLGWRGVSRYISPEFEKAFRLECKAIKKVRDEMGLDNVWVMLPFVRTTWEVEKVLKIMEEEGLRRGEKNFKVWLMAEVPSIVFLAEEFAKLCDGFSIGSNDLTQLVLGIDRDSGLLGKMGYFDERNPAVLKAIKMLIEKAHDAGVTVSICGQAPSTYPEITEFLIKEGIDSISVNPDVVLKTRKLVYETEKKICSS